MPTRRLNNPVADLRQNEVFVVRWQPPHPKARKKREEFPNFPAADWWRETLELQGIKAVITREPKTKRGGSRSGKRSDRVRRIA